MSHRADRKRGRHRLEIYAWIGKPRLGHLVHVRKKPVHGRHRCGGAKDRDDGILNFIEPADIVETENMVGMGVGNEHGIHAAHAKSQHLIAEIRRGINDDMLAGGLYVDTGSPALVARIIGPADRAGAPDGGNTGRSARAQESDFHKNTGLCKINLQRLRRLSCRSFARDSLKE